MGAPRMTATPPSGRRGAKTGMIGLPVSRARRTGTGGDPEVAVKEMEPGSSAAR
jgi:hypothetical protein